MTGQLRPVRGPAQAPAPALTPCPAPRGHGRGHGEPPISLSVTTERGPRPASKAFGRGGLPMETRTDDQTDGRNTPRASPPPQSLHVRAQTISGVRILTCHSHHRLPPPPDVSLVRLRSASAPLPNSPPPSLGAPPSSRLTPVLIGLPSLFCLASGWSSVNTGQIVEVHWPRRLQIKLWFSANHHRRRRLPPSDAFRAPAPGRTRSAATDATSSPAAVMVPCVAGAPGRGGP
ncbi:uncharacterized protein LOC141514844 [Macrotis lagotis]|uniref:uncharacterized protein LOC141514844 n=1 Tax=Macrotis lagotis TaxID=92651 RepID=UPI003D69439D